MENSPIGDHRNYSTNHQEEYRGKWSIFNLIHDNINGLA